MALYRLTNGDLRLEVASAGGVIEGFWRRGVPLLREGKKNGVATDSSCFPLVPFGNRVSGNCFAWQGKTYQFEPNVDWDEHYLHGDGWLGEWHCDAQGADFLTLGYQHQQGVYRYRVQQRFRLTAQALTVTISVINEGEETLPFGLGWHPFFPLAPETRIQAKAQGYWLEREQWLAGEFSESLPADMDFSQPAPLPRRWLNNGFAHWDGVAHILQPQAGYRLTMETDPPAPCYFLFVSDPAFDPGYQFDFFCLEPMSHAPDDHHRPGGGDLTLLAPAAATSMSMTLQVASLS